MRFIIARSASAAAALDELLEVADVAELPLQAGPHAHQATSTTTVNGVMCFTAQAQCAQGQQ